MWRANDLNRPNSILLLSLFTMRRCIRMTNSHICIRAAHPLIWLVKLYMSYSKNCIFNFFSHSSNFVALHTVLVSILRWLMISDDVICMQKVRFFFFLTLLQYEEGERIFVFLFVYLSFRAFVTLRCNVNIWPFSLQFILQLSIVRFFMRIFARKYLILYKTNETSFYF